MSKVIQLPTGHRIGDLVQINLDGTLCHAVVVMRSKGQYSLHLPMFDTTVRWVPNEFILHNLTREKEINR